MMYEIFAKKNGNVIFYANCDGEEKAMQEYNAMLNSSANTNLQCEIKVYKKLADITNYLKERL